MTDSLRSAQDFPSFHIGTPASGEPLPSPVGHLLSKGLAGCRRECYRGNTSSLRGRRLQHVFLEQRLIQFVVLLTLARPVSSETSVPGSWCRVSVPPAPGAVAGSCRCHSCGTLEPWVSECGPWTSSVSISWELDRDAKSQAHPGPVRGGGSGSAGCALASPPCSSNI